MILPFTHVFQSINFRKPRANKYKAAITLCAAFCLANFCLMPLQANATEKLEEVVVISSGTETPIRAIGTSVSGIDRDDIEIRGFSSLGDILRTEVGVAVTNSGGLGKASTLRIRGEEGYRTLVLVDGVDISDPTATQISPRIHHLMTGNSLARVEILRGPQGFIYGADAGGVVSITTQTPKEGNNLQLFTERGRYNTALNSASWGLGSETGSLFLSVDDVSTDGFNAREDDTTYDEDGYKNTTEHGKITLNGDGVKGEFIVRHTDARVEYDNCYTSSFLQVNDCHSEYSQSIGKFNLEIDQESHKHHMSYSRSKTQSDNFSAGEPSWQTDGSIEKTQYVGTYNVAETSTIIAGADAKLEELTADDELQSRDQVSVFAEWQAHLSKQLHFTIGSRFDDNEDFGEHLSSRISTAYLMELDDIAIKYRASVGNGFRAPSLYEINYNRNQAATESISPELKEELSRGAELGLDVYLNNETEIMLVAFKQEVTDQIEFFWGGSSGYYQQTEGTSSSKGYEFAISTALTSTLNLNTNLTYNKALDKDDAPRVRRPKWLANITLTSRLLNDTLLFNIGSRTLKDSIGRNGEPLDDYTLLDLSAQFRWSKQLSFHARVENATDREDNEIDGFNTAGRAFYTGLRINL